MRPNFVILLLFMVLSGCSTNRKMQASRQPWYFAEMDLLKLEFKGPLKNPKTLPYIKVSEDSIGRQRADFYFKSRRRPLKTGYISNVSDYRIFTTRSFDGKLFTNDTLISDGSRMVEFRSEYLYDIPLLSSRILFYRKIQPDTLEVSYFLIGSSNKVKIVRPTFDLDLNDLSESAMFKARYIIALKGGKITIRTVGDNDELGPMSTGSTPYTLYWSLFSLRPWMSITRY